MITVRVGRRAQITIPKIIRQQFGIQEGDQVALLLQGNQIILRPITMTLLDLRGSIPVSEPQDFSKINREVIATQTSRNEGDGS